MEQIFEDADKKTEQIIEEAAQKLEVVVEEAAEAAVEQAVETVKQGCWCLWK